MEVSMVSVTSPSIVEPRAGISENCVLRRNVSTQPYGRCSVCSLHLSSCHAWQSNGYSFAIIVLALASLLVGVPVISALFVAALLVVVVVKGIVDHRRTDVMIDQQHQIEQHNAALAREVEHATADLRRTNRALAATSLQLLEADQARLSFLANVTHELRTPLTSIRGAAQNLSDGVVGPLSEKQRQYVAIVEGETTRLIRVVNELLEFARSATERVERAATDVDLLEIARDTVAQVDAAARRADVDIKGKCVVVDPHLDDVDRYFTFAKDKGMKIVRVIDTHVHADHRSGGRALAQMADAPYSLHRAAPVRFAFDPLEDGQRVDVGNTLVDVVHTPGHAPEGISLVVRDLRRGDEPWFVCTGDTLFVGAVGRPDLPGDERKNAALLHESVAKLLALRDDVEVFPAHFGGSACGVGLSGKPSSTIGFEKRWNKTLTAARDQFIAEIGAAVPPKPAGMNAILAFNKGDDEAV
jgi:hydroxyacylglutathione hydrolase